MTVLYTTPGLRGIGDALFVTAVAHQVKASNHFEPIVVHSRNFDLFYNNPDVDFIICGFDESERGIRSIARESCRLPQIAGYRWSYNLLLRSRLFGARYNAHHGWPPQKRLLEEVAGRCGLHLSAAEKQSLRPYFWPFRAELQAAQEYRGAVCIHSNAATYWTPNKQWPVDRVQQVVDALVRSHRVVQLGSAEDAPLQGVIDLRGKTTIRETAAILAQARLFVGMEGGLMHLARGVDTRSVVIFTGFITPEYTGYDVNCNLFGAADRTDLPCWNRDKCNCDCAERVSVSQVLRGIEWGLAQERLPKRFEK